jgi:hypothetical protein
MVGSTAAANERALGVWAWQAALPVGWRQVVTVKALVVSAICMVLAGIVPYVLQFAFPFDEHLLSHVFRNTWTGWLGLLCGAVGLYSGALARDDYHGLLISVIPLSLLFFVMWLADPFLLVSPVRWGPPIWKEWTVAVRLLLIASVLVVFAGRLLKRAGQRRRWQVVKQAVILAPLVIMLTLWNLVAERSLLQKTLEFPHGSTWAAYGSSDVQFGVPWQVATVSTRLRGIANGRVVTYGRSISLEESDEVESRNLVVGQIEQDTHPHYFVYLRNGQIQEFPQAQGHLLGYSENGKWLWTAPTLRAQMLCGPYGIAISSNVLPDDWISFLQDRIGFTQALTSNRKTREAPTDFVSAGELSTPADQVVSIISSHAIVWQNGKTQIPDMWSTSGLIQGRGGPGPSGSSADAYETFPGSLAGTLLPGNRIAVGFPSGGWPAATAILKPTQNPRVYVLAGWTIGEINGVSDDDRWARRRRNSGAASDGDFQVVQITDNFSTKTVSRELVVNTLLAGETSMSLTFKGNYGTLPTISTAEGTFTWCLYQKAGPIGFQNLVADDNFPYENGLAMLNLGTGEQSLVPAPMPWSASATLILQKPNVSSLPGSNYAFEFPIWDKSTGQLALVQDDYIGFISLKDSSIANQNLKMQYARLPGIAGGAFLRNNEFLATDGTDLWVIPLSE